MIKCINSEYNKKNKNRYFMSQTNFSNIWVAKIATNSVRRSVNFSPFN